MQGHFQKKRGKSTPAIPTSSLPDIIFILLFFFMIATVLRSESLMVTNTLPRATEISKIENKSFVTYVYFGKPIAEYQAKFGSADRIQINNIIVEKADIGPLVRKAFSEMPVIQGEDGSQTSSAKKVAIKGHGKSDLGVKEDITQELRNYNALNVIYITLPKGK